jgi:outer membrane protein TolC
LEQALVGALEHSQQIKVFSELPLIRETAITEADAAFDWYAFIDSRWDDISDPIGNTLTAGPGINRFLDHNVDFSAGVRRRTLTGGQLEMAQRLGFQDNNSQFFVPDPQGTARLTFSFTQPLLRGRGKVYNTSLTVLARIDTQVAGEEFRRQLQAHLLEVSRAYWALYLERAVLYQRINSYMRGRQVFEKLEQRRHIDAPVNQIVSAEASVKQRLSELTRARAAVRNAESRLRSLVNDPLYFDVEIVPEDVPTFDYMPVDLGESVSLAIQRRPEVAQSLKQIKAACVRLNMSKHELLPALNLVTEAYVSGLEDRGQAFDAWGRQFDTGQPSYSIGFQYEVPIWNRAAKARLQRRRLESRQLGNQYGTTLETIRLEVEVAVRELQTSRDELSTKQQAMYARTMQLDALTKRWERLPGEDVTASLALENLLIAQDHLARAEFEYLQSQLTYNLSLVNLKRATGLLLEQEQVVIGRGCVCGLPTQVIDKLNAAASAEHVDHYTVEQAD